MKFDRIKLKHFRCFEDFEMEFAEKVTVLFGRNGVGKTSLIHAISKALSFIFYNDLKMKDIESLNAGNPNITLEGFKKDIDGSSIRELTTSSKICSSVPPVTVFVKRLHGRTAFRHLHTNTSQNFFQAVLLYPYHRKILP